MRSTVFETLTVHAADLVGAKVIDAGRGLESGPTSSWARDGSVVVRNTSEGWPTRQ